MEIPRANQDTMTGSYGFHHLWHIAQVKVFSLKAVQVKRIRLVWGELVSCWCLPIAADSSGRCSAAGSMDTSPGKRGISLVSFKAFLLLLKYPPNKSTFWKVFSGGWKAKLSLCCGLLNVFTAFFWELSGNCAVVIYWSASTAAGWN